MIRWWVWEGGRRELTGHRGLSRICPPTLPLPHTPGPLACSVPWNGSFASSQRRCQVGWGRGQGRDGVLYERTQGRSASSCRALQPVACWHPPSTGAVHASVAGCQEAGRLGSQACMKVNANECAACKAGFSVCKPRFLAFTPQMLIFFLHFMSLREGIHFLRII